jgi:hypothetical protein
MSKKSGRVTHIPPRTITTPARQQRSNAIRSAVDQFAARVKLTTLERHLLGLIIDETIEAVAPRQSTLTSRTASNEATYPNG